MLPLSAKAAGVYFLTAQFGADSGSKRMFFDEETSRSDLVEALFSCGSPPQLENCLAQQGKNVNTMLIHHLALVTLLPYKKSCSNGVNVDFCACNQRK